MKMIKDGESEHDIQFQCRQGNLNAVPDSVI